MASTLSFVTVLTPHFTTYDSVYSFQVVSVATTATQKSVAPSTPPQYQIINGFNTTYNQHRANFVPTLVMRPTITSSSLTDLVETCVICNTSFQNVNDHQLVYLPFLEEKSRIICFNCFQNRLLCCKPCSRDLNKAIDLLQHYSESNLRPSKLDPYAILRSRRFCSFSSNEKIMVGNARLQSIPQVITDVWRQQMQTIVNCHTINRCSLFCQNCNQHALINQKTMEGLFQSCLTCDASKCKACFGDQVCAVCDRKHCIDCMIFCESCKIWVCLNDLGLTGCSQHFSLVEKMNQVKEQDYDHADLDAISCCEAEKSLCQQEADHSQKFIESIIRLLELQD